MRMTSAAARLTKRSKRSSRRMNSRHSVKKCPEPVSAQARRRAGNEAASAPFPRPSPARGEGDLGEDDADGAREGSVPSPPPLRGRAREGGVSGTVSLARHRPAKCRGKSALLARPEAEHGKGCPAREAGKGRVDIPLSRPFGGTAGG